MMTEAVEMKAILKLRVGNLTAVLMKTRKMIKRKIAATAVGTLGLTAACSPTASEIFLYLFLSDLVTFVYNFDNKMRVDRGLVVSRAFVFASKSMFISITKKIFRRDG